MTDVPYREYGDKLDPCPRCGETVIKFNVGDYYAGDHLECTNDSCGLLFPCRYHGGSGEYAERKIGEDIIDWNTRTNIANLFRAIGEAGALQAQSDEGTLDYQFYEHWYSKLSQNNT